MAQNDVITFSHNPYTAYNGYHSSTRNMALIVSVGLLTITFSNWFQKKWMGQVVALMGGLMMIIAFMIGYKSAQDFVYFLNSMKNQKEFPKYIDTHAWMNWVYLTYTFMIAILVVFTLFLSSRLVSE